MGGAGADPVHTALADVVGAARLANRLERLARRIPSLKLYSKLAKQAFLLVKKESVESPGK